MAEKELKDYFKGDLVRVAVCEYAVPGSGCSSGCSGVDFQTDKLFLPRTVRTANLLLLLFIYGLVVHCCAWCVCPDGWMMACCAIAAPAPMGLAVW